jgi:hypothetical protein
LENKTEEERKADNMLKALELGEWGKGNTKSLYQYSKDISESDIALMERFEYTEQRLFAESNVTDRNVEQYMLDEIDEMNSDDFITHEESDLSLIRGDYANNFEDEGYEDYEGYDG